MPVIRSTGIINTLTGNLPDMADLMILEGLTLTPSYLGVRESKDMADLLTLETLILTH